MTATTTGTSTVSSTGTPPRAGRPTRPAASRHAGRAVRPAGCAAVRTARPPAAFSPAPRPVPAPRPALHLTARGRAVLVAVLVLLLLAAFSLGRTGAEGSTTVQPGVQLEQVTVQPGDTLWSVAQRVAPGHDPRPVVDQIRRLNDLRTPELQAGQQLLLPAAS